MQPLIWVTILILVFICIIPYKTIEAFKNDLDPNYTETNCYDYITKELNWDISHNIDQYLPKKDVNPKLYETERQKLIDKRKDMLQHFDAVKRRNYSALSNRYAYTQQCTLKKARIPDNLETIGDCRFAGNVLGYNATSKDAQYGKRDIERRDYKLDSFPDTDIRNEYQPNEGCVLQVNDPTPFFDTITGLAQLNMFDDELNKNNDEVDLNKKTKENIDIKRMANLYGINVTQDLDPSLKTNCTLNFTTPQTIGSFDYNYLDRHAIKCPDDELLSSVQLQTKLPNQYYKYTCCKPQTYDGCVKPSIVESKQTDKSPATNFQNPWELNKSLECNKGFLNSMKLQTSYNPNESWYDYSCSQVDKKYDTKSCPENRKSHDKRTSTFYCDAPKTTAMMPKVGGTSKLTSMAIDCGPNSAISNIKLVEDKDKYGYIYTCCTPRIDL